MDYLPPYTGTVLGWAIVVGGGGALYLYYKSDSRRRPIRAKASRAVSSVSSDPPRSRADRRAAGHSSSTATPNNNNSTKSSKQKSEPTARTSKPSAPAYDTVADEEDNKAWAKELAKTQQGTTFKASDVVRQQNRQKTVKQSSANRVAAELSGESSTAEGQSASHSPDLAASSHAALTSGNVDDMLEQPEDGPSVLRLTEPERYLPEKQKAPPKAPVQAESKKQRQNKKKAEERKQQQDELEKVRKVQMESQRRTAREARGEPAKNGMASAAATSAWTAPQKQEHVVNGNPLLDTFITEKVTTAEAPSKEAALHGAGAITTQKPSIPSEEEQMRLIQEEEDDGAWKTVGTKKTKSKRKDAEEADDGAVKPINQKSTAPAADKAPRPNSAYSVLTSDDDDGWTKA